MKKDLSKVETGMVKMSIYYPNKEDIKFDFDYYANKHLANFAEVLGDDLMGMEIEKAIGSANPDEMPQFVAVGTIYCKNMAVISKAMEKVGAHLNQDIPNYTNVMPQIMFSEVVDLKS